MALVRERWAAIADQEHGELAAIWVTYDNSAAAFDPEGPRGNRDDLTACPVSEVEVVASTRRTVRYRISRPDRTVWEDATIDARPNPKDRSVKPRLDRNRDEIATIGDLRGLSLVTE